MSLICHKIKRYNSERAARAKKAERAVRAKRTAKAVRATPPCHTWSAAMPLAAFLAERTVWPRNTWHAVVRAQPLAALLAKKAWPPAALRAKRAA
ncbi:hypothetical protein TIFTF001_052845 [Ficus carica]|uniref:Uncharacterized protein n=1 Tax=Ficus carica TaxID=3494 RepID=A0AA88ELL0_FICCA|nr:hypothetical protein TIFTF001_052845 [Ficus carica]